MGPMSHANTQVTQKKNENRENKKNQKIVSNLTTYQGLK